MMKSQAPTEEERPLAANVPRAIVPGASVIVPSKGLSVEDEGALSVRAMQGDMTAWNGLVQKHNHRVVVSLLARGVRIDRAKDLAQDAWLRLIEQQRDGKLTHLALPGLAIAQAGFLALEAARRARRTESSDDGGEVAAKMADPGADAETRLLAEEQLARAERVLAGCSPSARKVFRLVYGGEGLSHADVAEQVGLSLQRVRQIVCEVRKLLRAAVDLDGAVECVPQGVSRS